MGELKLPENLDKIDKYTIVQALGNGTSGVVYLVEDAGSKYALKLFKSSDDSTRLRFRRESATLARISHENLVKIFDVGEFQGFPYLAMEYLKGKALDSLIKENGKLPSTQALEITRAVVRALNELNKSNLVHRDVKPANIVILDNNAVKLIDLGLVGDLEQIKGETAFVGTPFYSSPEKTMLLKRPVDFSSDLYSVGITLFELLTGTVPFTGTLAEILQAHVSKVAPDVRDFNSEVSAGVSRIIAKLLAKDPDDRYRTSFGLLFDLDSIDTIDAEIKAGKNPKLGTKDQVSINRSFKFVERKAEIQKLKQAWERVIYTAPECDIVVGESGTGKSRICEAFLEGLDLEQTLVLRAKCQSFDRDLPFGPIREALSVLVEQCLDFPKEKKALVHQRLRMAAAGYESQVLKLSDSLKNIVPAAQNTAEVLGVNEEKDAFFKGISNFISNLANEWPYVVLYIDDMQWLDQSSVQVLKNTLDMGKGKKFFLLGTSRDDRESLNYLEKTKEKLQDHLQEYIKIKAFDQDQIAILLAQSLGTSTIDPLITTTIFNRSKGNPFIAIEYLRACIEQGFLAFKNAQWTLVNKDVTAIQLSGNVLDLIMKRVEACSGRAKDFLSFAAIYGNGFNDVEIAEAMSIGPEAVASIVQEIQVLDLIDRSNGKKWRFSHDKIPESLKSKLSKEDSELMIDKLTNILASKQDRTTEEVFVLARLYMQGSFDKNADRAIRALIDAGERSAQNYAHAEGYYFLKFAYDKVIALKLSSNFVSELATPLATCATILGHWSLARSLTDLKIKEAKDDTALVDALAMKVWSLKNEGDVTAAFENFKLAYKTIIGEYPLFLHWKFLVITWSWFVTYVLDMAEQYARPTVPLIARLAGFRVNRSLDIKKIANLFSDSVYLVLVTSRFDDLAHIAFQLTIIGHLKSDARTLAMGHSCIGYAMSLLRQNKLAAWHFEKSLSLSAKLEDKFLEALLQFRKFMGSFHGGVVTDLIQEGSQYQQLFENYLNPMELSTLISTFGYDLMEQGRYHEALPYITTLSSGKELSTGKASILNEIHGANQLWLYQKMVGDNQSYLDYKKAAFSLNNKYRFWAYVYRGASVTEIKERSHLGYVDDLADELLKVIWPNPNVNVDQFVLSYNTLESLHVLMNKYEAACKKENGRSEQQSRGRLLRLAMRYLYIRLHSPRGRAVLTYLSGRYYLIQQKYRTAEKYFRDAENLIQKYQINDLRLLFGLRECRARIEKIESRRWDLIGSLQMAMNIANEQGWKTKLDSFMSEFSEELKSISLLNPANSSMHSTAATRMGATRMGATVHNRARATAMPSATMLGSSSTSWGGATSQSTMQGSFGASRSLDAFLEISAAFTSSIDPVEQSKNVLAQIVKLFAAERGFVFTTTEEENLKALAGKNSDGEDLFELKGFSNTVVKKTFQDRKPVILTGTEEGEALGSESAVLHNLRSIMATPLIAKDKILGVVYLDSSLTRGLFTKDDIDLFSTLANYISVAFELSLMAKIELDKVNLQKQLEVQSAVAAEAKKVQVLVDNMEEALFSVDAGGKIVEPVSRFSEKIFGKSIAGQNVVETLFKDFKTDSEALSRVQSALDVVFGESELQWTLAEESFPKKLTYSQADQKLILRTKSSPLWNEAGLLERILFVVEDITRAEALEARAVQQGMETAMIEQLISNEVGELSQFLNSTSESLASFLKQDFANEQQRAKILRDLHTFKGSARLFGLTHLSKQIHEAETALGNLLKDSSSMDPTAYASILNSIQEVVELYLKTLKKIRKSDSANTGGISPLAVNHLSSILKNLIPQLKSKEAKEVQWAVERLNHVSLKPSLQRFDRMVVDIAEQLSKSVQYEVVGDALLDNEKLKLLQECCLHLIRNSLDHGIEEKTERIALGKSEAAKISVVCAEDSGTLNLSIEDDGRGIDSEIVARKAIEKGIITKAEAERMSTDQKVALIFAPNFSTKDSATDISGRGIGMDIVKKNIESMGGELKINTSKNKGSKFSISIPFVEG